VLENISNLMNEIDKLDDVEFAEDATNLVKDMISDAIAYVSRVCDSESVRIWFSNSKSMSIEDSKFSQEQLEILRRNVHNSFIGLVDSVNRLCDRIGCKAVWDKTANRVEYAEFAFTIVSSLFTGRRI
jgi:hypothetical protein